MKENWKLVSITVATHTEGRFRYESEGGPAETSIDDLVVEFTKQHPGWFQTLVIIEQRRMK